MIAYRLVTRDGALTIVAAATTDAGTALNRLKNVDILAQAAPQLEQHPTAKRALDLAHSQVYERTVGATVISITPAEFDFCKINGANRYYVFDGSKWVSAKLSYLYDYATR